MPKPVQIHLTNGELNAYVSATSVPVWEAIGWTLAETGDSGPVEEPESVTPSEEAPRTEDHVISTEGDVRNG